MTEDRDFKNIVRERAAKTGESYQTARRRLEGSNATFSARVDVLFRMPVGVVLGCTLETGRVTPGLKVSVLADQVVVHRGRVATLRRFKEDVDVVREGQFGILLDPPYEGPRPDAVVEWVRVGTSAAPDPVQD